MASNLLLEGLGTTKFPKEQPAMGMGSSEYFQCLTGKYSTEDPKSEGEAGSIDVAC